MSMTENSVSIRMIQHYMYCPRRFALLEINRDWCENAFVVKADILHEHVHDGSHSYSDSSKVVRSSVHVYNDEYNIYGVTDCIEFIKSPDGVKISGLEGLYKVRLVEYKPKAPKSAAFNETDAIQVFAQKICADYIWKCDCEAYLYYSDIRKRVFLPFDTDSEKYDRKLKQYLSEMKELTDSHIVPDRTKKQKCSGCSISDICFPQKKNYHVRDIIMSMKGCDF